MSGGINLWYLHQWLEENPENIMIDIAILNY